MEVCTFQRKHFHTCMRTFTMFVLTHTRAYAHAYPSTVSQVHSHIHICKCASAYTVLVYASTSVRMVKRQHIRISPNSCVRTHTMLYPHVEEPACIRGYNRCTFCHAQLNMYTCAWVSQCTFSHACLRTHAPMYVIARLIAQFAYVLKKCIYRPVSGCSLARMNSPI